MRHAGALHDLTTPPERLPRGRVAERLARGLRPSAIAEELGLSKATVSYHVRRLELPTPGDYVGRRAMVATLGYRGLPVSELCDMRIRHLRLHDPAGARFHVPDAKTEAGIREVQISPELVDHLVGHLDRLRRANLPTDPDAFVFPNVRGGRVTASGYPRLFVRRLRGPASASSPANSRPSRSPLRTARGARTSRSRCWRRASTCSSS